MQNDQKSLDEPKKGRRLNGSLQKDDHEAIEILRDKPKGGDISTTAAPA